MARTAGVAALSALAACTANEPYGARYDENGYSHTHRQHGLYNDAQYRYQRSRDDDDDVRSGYREPVYDDDGDLIYYRDRYRD